MIHGMLLLTTVAWGQTVGSFTEVGAVFSPIDLEWGLETTAGSPSVVHYEPYDTFFLNDQSLMVYETQVEAPSAACPDGKWGVGLAYKAFGNNGTNYEDLQDLVMPTPGTYYSCVAAHPTIVQLTDNPVFNGQTWIVYFKAEQDCTGLGTGCERYPGLGRIIIAYSGKTALFNVTPTFTKFGPTTTPVLSGVAQNMGYPKGAFVAGQYRLAFGQYPDVYLASSANTDMFTVSATPVVSAGDPATWGDDEVLSPSILCEGNQTLKMYPMGRSWDISPSVLTDQSMGLFESTSTTGDFDTFTEVNAAPYYSTAGGDQEMRHVHMSSASGYTSYGLFYSTTIGSGNEIRFAGTPGYQWQNMDSRRCP